MPKSPIWIVKLGGALIGHEALGLWLAKLAQQARSRCIVIVSGGGVFADTVREHQALLKIDDATAHQMALLAMRQFALALAHSFSNLGFGSELYGVEQLRQRSTTSGLWLWDACDLALSKYDLPKNWRVTSDTLSLCLCAELAGSGLVLVKNDEVLAGPPLRGIDEQFVAVQSKLAQPVWRLGWSQVELLDSVLAGDDCDAQRL